MGMAGGVFLMSVGISSCFLRYFYESSLYQGGLRGGARWGLGGSDITTFRADITTFRADITTRWEAGGG